MDSFPRFEPHRLSPKEINTIVQRIEADQAVDRSLVSVQDASWASKDLHVGEEQVRPSKATLQLGGDVDSASSRTRKVLAEHMDPQIQQDAFEFIGSDVRVELQLQKPVRWIRVRGVGRVLYHFQLYAAFWLLVEERGPRRGTIQADMMGLGKTTMAYLYMIFNCSLAEMAQSRRENPRGHLADGQAGRCPSQDKWPILCSCVTNGVTNRRGLHAVHGASLIIIPASLLSTWDTEWKMMDVGAPIALRLYVHHHHYARARQVPLALRHHLRLVRNDDGSCRLDSTISHRVMVLTTIESYTEQVACLFRNINCRGPKPARLVTFPGDHDGLAWARVVRDEAHLFINWETQFFKIMQSLAQRRYQPPNFLPLTATPTLRNGIGDMMSLVRTINSISPQLEDLPAYANFLELEDLNNLRDAQLNLREKQQAGADVDVEEEESVADAVGRLQVAYCIRRRNSSRQNDKGLASLPEIRYFDVRCSNPDPVKVLQLQRVEWLLKEQLSQELKDQRAAWARDHPNKPLDVIELEMFLDNAAMPRMLATLPWLTELGFRYYFTWSYMVTQGWHEQPQTSMLARNIAAVEQSSGKLLQLRKILENLGTDVQGRPEKMVVVSEYPVVCLAVLVYLRSLNVEAKWMHAHLDTTEREDLASEFQADRVEDRKAKPCRVLVGTTRILGQGITLHRAFRLVLMEPSRHAAVEAQIAKRVHRIGSNTDQCWIYRLINPASRVEEMLVRDQRNQLRNQFLAEEMTEAGPPSALDKMNWVMGANEQGEGDTKVDVGM